MLTPGRRALLDGLLAEQATEDICERLFCILQEGSHTSAPMPLRRPETWTPEARDVWRRLIWLWECAVTGRDPADTDRLPTPDELTLLRLELL